MASTTIAPTSSSSPLSSEDLVYNAKLAEQGERYDEMCVFMKDVATTKKSLSVEERNLLSVAYKNAVGSRRASWRIMSNVEQRKSSKGLVEHANLACEFRKRVETELNTICEDILSLLDNELIPNASGPEFVVFYYKMKGDYCRYMAEFSQDSSREASKTRAQEAYENATKIATTELSSTDPVRLGLALNYSVFNYEILNDPTEACDMARKAFDDAIQELDSVAEESYRDSTLIMHLLRDNLTLWNPQDEQAATATGATATGAPVVDGEKDETKE